MVEVKNNDPIHTPELATQTQKVGKILAIPMVVKGPWSFGAREQAVYKGAEKVFEEFHARSVKHRNWSPYVDLPIQEIKDRGNLLSSSTTELILGHMGVEDFIADYMKAGLESYGNVKPFRNLFIFWGGDEIKHEIVWRLVLLHSGKKTDEELKEYESERQKKVWTPTQHKGVDGMLGALVYGMIQEKATDFSYSRLDLLIRADSELPPKLTLFEKERGLAIGASGGTQLVRTDEIAHNGVYTDLVLLYLQYFPDMTLEKISEVIDGFTMPAVKLLPNRKQFLLTVRDTDLYTAELQKQRVFAPIYRSLGFANRGELDSAYRELKTMSDEAGKVVVGS